MLHDHLVVEMTMMVLPHLPLRRGPVGAAITMLPIVAKLPIIQVVVGASPLQKPALLILDVL